jgi:hypothetical protein
MSAASASGIVATIDDLGYGPVRAWKWIGLAGVVGVAALGVAGGALAVQRRRREYVDADVDQIRRRLHARHADALARSD